MLHQFKIKNGVGDGLRLGKLAAQVKGSYTLVKTFFLHSSTSADFLDSPFLREIPTMTTFPVPLVPKSYTESVLFLTQKHSCFVTELFVTGCESQLCTLLIFSASFSYRLLN
jgi:hypothetical protein